MKRSTRHRLLQAILTALSAVALPTLAPAATFSLAEDFNYTDNRTNSLWSYRLDGFNQPVPAFPLLTSSNRDVNALWGSTFPSPPRMWSEPDGYWGIGRNLSGKPLFSARNGITWQPGEVLLHPKGGAAPSGLVVGWTAPSNMVVDVACRFVRGADEGDGIGYQIVRRSRGVDVSVVARDNIGSGLTNHLTGVLVSQGDELFFRFNTCGNPVGDISRADIRVESQTIATGTTDRRPLGGTVAAGSDFTFSLPRLVPGAFQWHKDGQPIPGETNATCRLRNVKLTDAGTYSVAIDSLRGAGSQLRVTPPPDLPERFRSPVPRQVFARTLAEQEAQLKTNALMLRFADSRNRLAADPHRPRYHFVSPESQMNDPNGLCFWRGRGHLFYQAFPADKFPKPEQLRDRLLQAHWGHAITDDWVHWRDLPYALYPGVEKVCASGGTWVEENRVIAFYPGWEAGQMVAIADDPLLLNWEKLRGRPVQAPASGDSCIWKEGDTYYGLIGCRTLLMSHDLVDWKVRNASFLGATSFAIDDGSCPTFLPIGDKHLLLLFSHSRGGQYLLGDYDRTNVQFTPYGHGRFNHGTVAPGGVHAPSAVADGQGGVINILNVNDGKHSDAWDQLLSLAQRLTLGPDKRLRIEPVAAIVSLRSHHHQIGQTELPANQDLLLQAIQGNSMELMVEIDPQQARWVQLNVLRSPNAEEQTSITFFNYDRPLAFWYHTKGMVSLDASRSSSLPDVWPRAPEQAVLERSQGETLRLRVFVDRSIVEVFVNERQYLAARVYPGRPDSVGVSLRAHGQPAVIRRLEAWQMKAIWN